MTHQPPLASFALLLRFAVFPSILAALAGCSSAGPSPSSDGGTSSGEAVHKCTGSPTPCSLLSSSTCTNAIGCVTNDRCDGLARSCSLISSSCFLQDGCSSGSTSTSPCTGIASSCSSRYSSYSCMNQQGCSWKEDCTGAPLSCSLLTLDYCALQPGCAWE